MGGLICRSYLQNSLILNLDDSSTSTEHGKGVDKLFTYGTPHGGIEARTGFGWASKIAKWLDVLNSGAFEESEMRRYLDLPDEAPLQSLNNKFPENRVFCMIGTNSRDYDVAFGGSSATMGEFSDGLVKIENAHVFNPAPESPNQKRYAPRAYVYRSHSGHFGLVNSEEGYQSLQRFLFGNFAVTVSMSLDQLHLPEMFLKKLKSEPEENLDIGITIETDFGVRGLPMQLNSRNVSEESAIFHNYHDLMNRPQVLLTTFLMIGEKLVPERETLGFTLRVNIRMPEMEIDGIRYGDSYEGSSIFSDRLIVELIHEGHGLYGAKFGWDQETPGQSPHELEVRNTDHGIEAVIPIVRNRDQHINGALVVTAKPWNYHQG